MTPIQREQLEERLKQLDDAILTLRRGFAKRGQRPPQVCSLMEDERKGIARLLSLDRALTTATYSIDWTSDASERTPPLGTKRLRVSLWERACNFCRSLIGGPDYEDSQS